MKSKCLSALLLCSVNFGMCYAEQSYNLPGDTTVKTQNLKEVIVLSQKDNRGTLLPFDAPDLYLPISNTTVSNVTLEKRNVNDIVEATRFLPSVKTRTTYGGFQEFYIRGFANQMMSVDGIPDQRSFVTSMPVHDLSNVDNIELLRGSASALYGQGIVGGILNITRKQPSAERQIKARVGTGSWKTYSGFFSMQGKVLGPLNYYASISHSTSAGWRGNHENRFSIYATASAWFTKQDFFQITYNFANDNYGTDTGLPMLVPYDIYTLSGNLYLPKYSSLPNLDRKARYNNESDFLYNRTQDISIRYEHVFNEHFKLRDVALFRYDNINYFSTEGMSYLTSNQPIYDHYYELKGEKIYINLDTLINSAPLRFNHVSYSYANHLDLTGKFDIGSVKNSYMAGYAINYMHRPSFGWTRNNDISGPGVNSHIPVNNPYSGGYINAPLTKVSVSDRFTQGFYISDLIDFLPQFKAMISGRYDWYKYRSAANIPLISGTMDWVKPDKYSSIVNKALSYRVGAVYLPIESFSIFASAGSFFKPNNTLYNDNAIYIDGNGKRYFPKDGAEVFAPEKGNQFEGGLKFEKSGIKAEIDGFYIHKKNVVTTLGSVEEDGVMMNIYGQVGTMHSAGFDLDFSYKWRTFELMAGYTYTDARVGKIAPNDYIQTNSDRGNRYTYIPENQFFFGADYEIEKGFFKHLGAALTVNYQDKIYTNLADNLWLKGYWMTNLSLRYRLLNGVSVIGTVNNLFNTKYYYSTLGTQLMPGPDINYKITLSYTFK